MKLGRKKVQDIRDLLLDVRHLRLVFIQHVRIDDRHVDSPQIQQGVDVLGRASGHDRQDVKVVAVVHHPRDLGSQTERRSFQLPTSETDRPGVYPLLGRLDCALSCRGRRFHSRAGALLLRLRRLEGQRTQKCRYDNSCKDRHQETRVRCQKPLPLPEAGMAPQYRCTVPMDQPLLHTVAATMMMVDRIGRIPRLLFFPARSPAFAPEFRATRPSRPCKLQKRNAWELP